MLNIASILSILVTFYLHGFLICLCVKHIMFARISLLIVLIVNLSIADIMAHAIIISYY